MLRDHIAHAVRRWKESPDRGDANALIQSLETALAPIVDPRRLEPPRPRRSRWA